MRDSLISQPQNQIKKDKNEYMYKILYVAKPVKNVKSNTLHYQTQFDSTSIGAVLQELYDGVTALQIMCY